MVWSAWWRSDPDIVLFIAPADCVPLCFQCVVPVSPRDELLREATQAESPIGRVLVLDDGLVVFCADGDDVRRPRLTAQREFQLDPTVAGRRVSRPRIDRHLDRPRAERVRDPVRDRLVVGDDLVRVLTETRESAVSAP